MKNADRYHLAIKYSDTGHEHDLFSGPELGPAMVDSVDIRIALGVPRAEALAGLRKALAWLEKAPDTYAQLMSSVVENADDVFARADEAAQVESQIG